MIWYVRPAAKCTRAQVRTWLSVCISVHGKQLSQGMVMHNMPSAGAGAGAAMSEHSR